MRATFADHKPVWHKKKSLARRRKSGLGTRLRKPLKRKRERKRLLGRKRRSPDARLLMRKSRNEEVRLDMEITEQQTTVSIFK